MQMSSRDPYGRVTALTQQITVINTKGQNVLAVYSSSGECVYREELNRLSLDIVSFTLPQGSSFAVAFNSQTGQPLPGSGLSLEYRQSSGSSLAGKWNGLGMNKQALSSGVYTVQLLRTAGSGSSIVEARQVTLLNTTDRSTLNTRAYVYPNPAGAGSAQGDDKATLRYIPTANTMAAVDIYNLAGERVLSTNTVNAMSGGWSSISLDLEHMAPGTYMLSLSEAQNHQVLARQLIKLAVIR
jgi:hypothetical protein